MFDLVFFSRGKKKVNCRIGVDMTRGGERERRRDLQWIDGSASLMQTDEGHLA